MAGRRPARCLSLAGILLSITPHAFDSALVIMARGALIGGAHVTTTMLGSATMTTKRDGAGVNRIPIVNTGPALDVAPVAAPASIARTSRAA